MPETASRRSPGHTATWSIRTLELSDPRRRSLRSPGSRPNLLPPDSLAGYRSAGCGVSAAMLEDGRWHGAWVTHLVWKAPSGISNCGIRPGMNFPSTPIRRPPDVPGFRDYSAAVGMADQEHGPPWASIMRFVDATSSASELKGFCAATTWCPLACRRGMILCQLEPSAQAPPTLRFSRLASVPPSQSAI
jgi:hypothetical protein